ncbi:MAG TPA: TraR/DksA C4-type zinc finger protein [Acidimicrobiales bacterium]|nr:TraR/DksA C4-type zinc finger protein [Acidimicrobiales bacterium]
MEQEAARRHLSEERERLEAVRVEYADLHETSEQASLGELSNLDQHQADIGTETFDRERDLSLLEQVEAELADIEHALERLEEGTYGTCEACGKPIGDERLEAVPAARFCLEDQDKAEHEAGRNHANERTRNR